MNIYLLVEGKRTEKIVYTSWLIESIPDLQETYSFDEVSGNSIYSFSGEGFPQILGHALPNAIQDVIAVGTYDALVIVFDCDDLDVDALRLRVLEIVEGAGGLPGRTELVTVIQKRCIESWLLGNKKFVPRVAQSADLISCKRFYDVNRLCPECMTAPVDYDRSISTFHASYLKAVFSERRLSYTKSRPGVAASIDYLEQLRQRFMDGDLPSIGVLFDFIDGANGGHAQKENCMVTPHG